MKKYLTILLFLNLFYSCTKETVNPDSEPEEEDKEHVSLLDYVNIRSDTQRVNIFEEVGIRMFLGEEDDGFSVFALVFRPDLFDSIVWHIPGVMHKTSGPNPLSTMFGQAFHKAGEYDFSLTIYKDGEVVKKKELALQVIDVKDFLNVRWEDGEENDKSSYFHSSVEGYAISQEYFHQERPYATLKISYPDAEWEDYFEMVKQSRERLTGFLTERYKAPFMSLDSGHSAEELDKMYGDLFSQKIEGLHAIAIWKTLSSKLVLTEQWVENGSNYYMVYAEPI